MAVVKPFPGIRFDADRVGDLAEVVSPPYDVIDDEGERKLLERNPFNVIRIELSHAGAHGGPLDDARYAEANETLDDWIRDGVLHTDDTPAFYAYAQTYRGPDGKERERRGFFALVRLERPDEGGAVRPHESTIAGPKADRLKLISATRANVSPIFSLFDDPSGQAGEILAAKTADAPPAAFEDEQGVRHRLWVIDDADQCATLAGCLANRNLYIADGHHRFETALTYRDQRRAAGGPSGSEAPFDFVMMYLADVNDPGLAVFPIHRLVKLPDGVDFVGFLEKHAGLFERADLSGSDRLAAIRKYVLDAAQPGLIAYAKGQTPARLAPGPGLPDFLAERDVAPALAALDITVLHEAILAALDVSFSAGNLEFVHDIGEALTRVDRGEFDLAFLLQATRVRDMLAVVEAGLTMPQKSTFFYPKPATGLVLRRVE